MVYSSFCNKSGRALPVFHTLASAVRAKHTDIDFFAADAYTNIFNQLWIKFRGQPRLYLIRKGENSPVEFSGTHIDLNSAVRFLAETLGSHVADVQFPPEEPYTFSEEVPEKNDGPVIKVVGKNFEKIVKDAERVRKTHSTPLVDCIASLGSILLTVFALHLTKSSISCYPL